MLIRTVGLELADVLDALVVLDAPAAVGALARDRLPERLVELRRAHALVLRRAARCRVGTRSRIVLVCVARARRRAVPCRAASRRAPNSLLCCAPGEL